MNKLIEYFARQGTFTNLITLFVLVLGIYSVVKIQREVFPNINFDVITVSTPYPGASAEVTERLITNPLEQDLREVDGIKKLSSVSVENMSVIVLQLDPDQTTSDEAEADIQDVVDAFQSLPDGAEDPVVVVAESKLRPTVTVSLVGDVDEMLLRKTAKKLEREIEKISEVAKVNYDGLRDLEIRVEAIPEKLRQYRVSLSELIRSLQRNNINIPGGTLEAEDGNAKDMIVRTIGEFESSDDVGNVVIRANALAEAIRIKDVAKVTEGFAKKKIGYRTNGVQSINLTVLKKDKRDAIVLVNKVRELVEKLKPTLAEGIRVSLINDSSYFVKRRLKVLSGNLLVGLVLVLIVLSLVLPWRVAGVTAFGIPFSFLGALAIFYFGDVSLNLISMMGLIIVVGMLVDDAIVVTENAQAKMEEGLPPMQAAIEGTKEIWAPITASVLTTVMAFAPLMMMSGIFGKFVKYIPLGVIIALLVSLWECYFILPHHMGNWVKPVSPEKKSGGIFGALWLNVLAPAYGTTVRWTLRLRYLVVLLTIGLFFGSIYVAVKKMDFILFPPGAIDSFKITAEAPVGTPLSRTSELMRPIEAEIAKLPKNELQDFTTQIGLIGEGGVNNSKRGGAYAQIMVYLTAETERSRNSKEITADLKEKIGQPEGFIRFAFEQQRGGPPVGKPVSVSVRGDTYKEILPVVQEIKKEVSTYPGVSDLTDSFIEGKEEVIVKVNEAEAAAAGLSMSDIGTAVRAAYEGVTPTAIRTLDEEIKIRVTMTPKNRSNLDTLNDLVVPNARGNLVPLTRVARFENAKGIATYEHEENQRQVTIGGEIDTKVSNARAINLQLQPYLQALRDKYPDVTIATGGESSDTEESLQTLKESFAFAFFGIILLLIMLFKNIHQPIIISTTIPLGVIAVIWSFYMHDAPLTFLAAIGVIALAGVIVNNAIVFVDFINKARSKGLDRFASIIDSGQRRLRPIFLTTVTTSAGILPTVYGIGGLDPFVVPIAMALGWGIAFGSVLTTLVLPAVVGVFDDFIAIFNWLRKENENQHLWG